MRSRPLGITSEARSPTSEARSPTSGQGGSVLTVGWVGLAVTALALVLVVDLTAYLVAAGRAQAAADAAALAAVAAADRRSGVTGIRPEAAATRVARASGAQVRRCDCRRGRRSVEVVVGVPVRAIAVTRFAGRTVTARARAHLVRDRVTGPG